jgi:hypothetical protein
MSSQTKDIELVRKIIEKTKGKKIYWNKIQTGYQATVPGVPASMHLIFSRPDDAPPDTWYLFTVRTAEGDVLRVENNTSGLNALAILTARAVATPLVSVVNELFAIVKDVGEGGVERALRQLDQI